MYLSSLSLGIPTAESFRLDGLANGEEAAWTIVLGADLEGEAQALLTGAASGPDADQAIACQKERFAKIGWHKIGW